MGGTEKRSKPAHPGACRCSAGEGADRQKPMRKVNLVGLVEETSSSSNQHSKASNPFVGFSETITSLGWVIRGEEFHFAPL